MPPFLHPICWLITWSNFIVLRVKNLSSSSIITCQIRWNHCSLNKWWIIVIIHYHHLQFTLFFVVYIIFYHLKFTSSTGDQLISPSSRLGLLGRQYQALGHLQRGALHRQQRQLARHLRGQAMARWHDTWPNSGWTGMPLTCHYDERSIKHWNRFSAKKYCGLFNLRQEMKARTQQEETYKVESGKAKQLKWSFCQHR